MSRLKEDNIGRDDLFMHIKKVDMIAISEWSSS